MKTNPDNPVKSATRAVDILELVAASESPLTFGEIGEALRIPSSSLFYLLNTLAQRGYLVQHEQRRTYSLGGAVDALAARGGRTRSWRHLAIPLLDEITATVNETSHYVEQRGDEIECISTKLPMQTLMPVLHTGQRASLYVFSGGKVLLANMPDDAIEAYIARIRFEPFTPHTLNSAKALWREIREIRVSGFGYSRDEHTLGVTGVSIALRSSTQVVGTIGVALPSVRFTPQTDAEICRQLTKAVARFSAGAQRTPARPGVRLGKAG